jgi:hypothetical protein
MVDDAATADWDNYDNATASLEALNVDTDAIKSETAAILDDTDLIDDGTSGLAKIATDAAAILVTTDKFAFTVANQVDANALQIEGADATDTINAACDASIETYGLDHLVSASVTGTDVVDNSIIAQMVDDAATADWDGYDNETASLEALNVDLDAIPTTAMRGTDNAALASVVGALNDAAAADEVTSADTLVQYVKQLINILAGAPGVVTLKAAAAPASGVSLSEMIRAIYDDTNELQVDDIPGKLPAALVGGRIDATVDATGMESGAVSNILTTQMAESYAANGVAPTLAEAQFAIHQMLMDFSISGTTMTVEKLGGTTAFLVTLDDGTNPTSANRA